jgi:phosphoribosylamine--glycine ligase
MNVMVVGPGGREHALVWKIARSPLVKKIICAPGNPGIARHADLFDVAVEDREGMRKLAISQKIDLAVIGPGFPFVLGLADELEKVGILVCGPGNEAAKLEGSKSFAREIFKKYSLGIVDAEVFDDYDEAERYILSYPLPVVIRADGPVAGVGARVCETFEEAIAFLRRSMIDGAFGASGEKVVVEKFLFGQETTFILFTDGKNIIPLPSCGDHERIGDGETGPNAGGMGAYSPAPSMTSFIEKKAQESIFQPLLHGMREEGKPFKGILGGKLVIDRGNPALLDLHIGFGDLEAQVLLVRMKSDIVPLLVGCAQGNLGDHSIEIDTRTSLCVVMTSGGYPGAYQLGLEIKGLEEAEGMDDVMVFHEGTRREGDTMVNAGGRVFGVTARGDTLRDAISLAYEAVDKISWDGAYYRKDIGFRALERGE